jgi:hypothetical protein
LNGESLYLVSLTEIELTNRVQRTMTCWELTLNDPFTSLENKEMTVIERING